jgi:hypothetical protein
MLKEIMSRIAYDEGKEPEELIPGDYFDFIGGTGFGAYVFRSYREKSWLNMDLQIRIVHVRNSSHECGRHYRRAVVIGRLIVSTERP